MEMPGLLRVPFTVYEVRAVLPPAEIPLAELDGNGHFAPCEDQRHVLVSLIDLTGKTHNIALNRLTAMKFFSDLAEALKKLEDQVTVVSSGR